jgi:hypothetical protein
MGERTSGKSSELHLRIVGWDQAMVFNLVPPVSYREMEGGVLRIWDAERTWIVGPERLEALIVMNEHLGFKKSERKRE